VRPKGKGKGRAKNDDDDHGTTVSPPDAQSLKNEEELLRVTEEAIARKCLGIERDFDHLVGLLLDNLRTQ